MLPVVDLRKTSYVLGVKFDFHADRLFLSLYAYFDKITNAANISAASPTRYLLALAHPLYEKMMSYRQKNKRKGTPYNLDGI